MEEEEGGGTAEEAEVITSFDEGRIPGGKEEGKAGSEDELGSLVDG